MRAVDLQPNINFSVANSTLFQIIFPILSPASPIHTALLVQSALHAMVGA